MPEPIPNLIPDQHEREQALDTARSFIVEAPAGSGKTGLLIQRFLKLLAIVDEPGELLAITFTRKATAEMQERVLAQLTSARDATPPANAFDHETRPLAQAALARDRQRGWALLDHPRRLYIRTIDSVCAEIARGLPILSGSGGGQSPTTDAAALHEEAAGRTLMQLGGPDEDLSAALELLLLHRDGSLADCASLIAEMLASRDQWGELVPLTSQHLAEPYLDSVVLPKLQKALDKAICRSLTRLTQIMPDRPLARLCRLADDMADAEGYKGAPSPIALCRGRSASPAARAEDVEHWRALIHLLVKPSKPRDWRKAVSANIVHFEILKPHQAELKRIIAELEPVPDLMDELCRIDSLPPSTYPPEQWAVTKALFRVLSRALVELQFVFAARAQCDFTELGLLARSALRRDTALDDLRTAAGMTLQHLLVDEMQDTSSGQYELIQLLTQSWDGHSQTVFLVGDPKQSIYLFRQARVERFVRTMRVRALGDVPLTPLQLTSNFRSQRALVTAFNDDFALLFPRPVSPDQPDPLQPELVPFRAASPIRPATPAAGRVWHATALPYSADSAECSAMRTAQSRAYAEDVRALVQSSPTDGTTAVLVRTRTHLLDIVKSFKAAAIPYRAVEIEPLGERQEILDLLALTRALLHPADRTAWLAVLRAPWCGLALADLHTLTGQDDPACSRANILDLIEDRGDLLSPDGIARLQPVWTVLTAALAQRGRLPLARWIDRTWRALNIDPYLSSEARANTQRYLTLLDELEEDTGTLDLPKLIRRLEKLYAAPSVHPGAVDLMTIHGSKGLEWDTVFIPALERSGRISTPGLLAWLEIDPEEAGADDTAHGILAPIQGKGRQSEQLNKWMRSIESARESAERKRLFYVACTRAREALHLFAAPARKADGSVGLKPDSLLSSAWPAAETVFSSTPTNLVVIASATTNLVVLPRATTNLGAPGLASETWVPPTTNLGAPGLDSETWVTPTANLLAMPTPQPPFLLDLAAQSELAPRILDRIPLSALPTPQPLTPAPAPQPHFSRPEGSFAARAFGNALHTFLELLTEQTIAPEAVETWSPRIAAVLRANGLAAPQIQRFTAAVLRGLANTLADPEGRWLLSPHPEASHETSLVTLQDGTSNTIRLDRTFLGGHTPQAEGHTHRWIVDYKTASHAQGNAEAFLKAEQSKYQSQLEHYAQQINDETHPIRLALYYPMLPHLLWWPYNPKAAN